MVGKLLHDTQVTYKACGPLVLFGLFGIFGFHRACLITFPTDRPDKAKVLFLIAGFDHSPGFQNLRNKNRCHQISWFSLKIKNMEIFNLTKNKCCNGTLIINLISRIISFKKFV